MTIGTAPIPKSDEGHAKPSDALSTGRRPTLRPPPGRWRRWTTSLRVLPDYIIPGAQKCGTTALQEYLVQHPLILPPLTKEINYFSDNRLFARGPAWYRAHFPLRSTLHQRGASAGIRALTGEATPKYLFDPSATKRMAQLIPGVKLIVMLRNPVERGFSQYHMHLRHGAFSPLPDWAEVVARELRVLQRNDSAMTEAALGAYSRGGSAQEGRVQYLARGLYCFQIERLFEHFPREQVLVLFTESMRGNPQPVYSRVLNFLGLPDAQLPDPNPKNSASYPPMPPALRNQLEDFFRPFNQRLEEMLGESIDW